MVSFLKTQDARQSATELVFNNVDSTGWGHLGKYVGGSAATISRNGTIADANTSFWDSLATQTSRPGEEADSE